MTTHRLELFSKSRAETLWDCSRLEFLKYVYGEYGLKSLAPAFELEFGKIIHEASHAIASTQPYGDVAPAVSAQEAMIKIAPTLQMENQMAQQWGAIAEGLVRAYLRRIWPGILREFEVVDAEVPMVMPIDKAAGIWFVCKPDLILRHRVTKELWYWEHKTTGSVDARWINSWSKAVQVHTGIKAAERKYGEKFGGCYVLGWYKGYNDQKNQIQQSPFAWGWVNRGAPGIVAEQYSTSYQRGKGWERFPTWLLNDGLGMWVRKLDEDGVLMKQFAKTPPIMMREDLVDDFIAQLRAHAQRIAEYRRQAANVRSEDEARELLNASFPQNFNHCDPTWGKRTCQFKDLCWQSWVAADPISSGLYVRNSPDETSEHRREFIELIEAEST